MKRPKAQVVIMQRGLKVTKSMWTLQINSREPRFLLW